MPLFIFVAEINFSSPKMSNPIKVAVLFCISMEFASCQYSLTPCIHSFFNSLLSWVDLHTLLLWLMNNLLVDNYRRLFFKTFFLIFSVFFRCVIIVDVHVRALFVGFSNSQHWNKNKLHEQINVLEIGRISANTEQINEQISKRTIRTVSDASFKTN